MLLFNLLLLIAPPHRYERVAHDEARVIVVVNAARHSWQAGDYGLWVGGGGSFKQVYCSQVSQPAGQPMSALLARWWRERCAEWLQVSAAT